MKHLLFYLLITSFIGCNSKSNVGVPKEENLQADFTSFNNLTCTPGISNTEKANGFKQVYEKYSSLGDFEDQLINFLNSDECIINYKYVGMFIKPNNSYTDINNYSLTEKVLKSGLERVEERTDENAKYEKCGLLWDISIFYFENNKMEEARYYSKLTKDEKSMNCGLIFPALEAEERERFLNFFEKI